MTRLIDLTGKGFGRLIVIKRNYPNGKKGQPMWLCSCDCGTEEIIVSGGNLRNGQTKSCGCLQKERTIESRRLPPGLASMRYLINSYKKSARIHKYEYNLTEEQFKILTRQDCYYCGAKPSGESNYRVYNGSYIYNGLDRIDNTKGYMIDNVVPCCKICNYAKKAKTLQEYKDWIKRSYNKIFG